MERKMNEIKKITENAPEREEGASLVEYALLVALIAVVCIVALRAIGGQVSQNFSSVNSVL